jgi:glycine/D-amino acid oxidase-like deaminating enzyme
MLINNICGWTKMTSPWQQYRKLENNQSADWAVIGAGFTGIAVGCYNASSIAKGNIMGTLITEHALGNTSVLVDLERSFGKSTWILPKWLFSPLANIRLAYGRSRGFYET